MNKRKIVVQVLVLALVILAIVFGGRIERGYYAVASEPFVAVFGALVIWARCKTKKE